LNAEPEGFPRNVPIYDPPATLVFTPLRPFAPNNGRVASAAVQAKDRRQAIDIFVKLAADYSGTLERRDFGDFALYDPQSDALLMLRGRVVAEIKGETRQAPAMLEASRLNDELNRFFETPSR
jgi:hypothetical protein